MEITSNQVQDLLMLTCQVNQSYSRRLFTYIETPVYRKLAVDYLIHSTSNFDPGLNVFLLVSNYYYKENLHSDILKEILDPRGIHKEGDRFLVAFIDYLNSRITNGAIDKANYQNTVVEREAARIDITVKDKFSKKAIIIENKIHAAGDMDRQIPRYWLELEKQGYTIDSVVYLILNGYKQPDTNGWTELERKKILPYVLNTSAYDETTGDLYHGWLLKCETISERIDTTYFLKQYNQLIAFLGGKQMNKPLMEDFLNSMLQDQNFETAHALKDMLISLTDYRRDKLVDEFRYKAVPFIRVGPWKNLAVIDNYFVGDKEFAIDIIVTDKLYQIQFFERKFNLSVGNDEMVNPVDPILQEVGYSDQFFTSGRRKEKKFNFPKEEKELYIFIRGLIDALSLFEQKRKSRTK
ncbi:MAG: PD-(D/E)XK nuclease family protein [Bacteroidota bacterium]